MADIMIDVLSKKLHVSEIVTRKANEFKRRADLKHLNVSYSAYVALAAIVCSQTLDKETLKRCAQCSGITTKALTKETIILRTALDLEPEITIKRLCVCFGCVDLTAYAERILKVFQKQFATAQQDAVDCSRPVYAAAALTIAVKKHSAKGTKLKLDVGRLREMCGYVPQELRAATALLEDALTKYQERQKKKRKRKKPSSETPPETALASASTTTDDQQEQPKDADDQRKIKKKLSYEEWRKSILCQ